MSLSHELTQTLEMVAEAASAAEDPWWIISSAAVALHGVDELNVGDVDVLMSRRDAARVLLALGIEPKAGVASGVFSSEVLGQWQSPPLTVEIMASFRVNTPSGWQRISPRTRERVDVHGATLFVPSKAELLDLLHLFGRPKDRERAEKLKAFTNEGATLDAKH